jgi:hypothetical protein
MAIFGSGKPCFAAEELDPDEEFLREAGVATDGASLLAFLDREVPKANVDPSEVGQLIAQLGAGEFPKREEASRLLVTIGPLALPALRQAERHADLEVARRASGCVREINKPSRLVLAPAAARLLVKKRPPAAIEVLLRYLPYAVDDETIDEVSFGLEAWAVNNGKLDPAFLAALNDSSPTRRALAACLAGIRSTPDYRARVRLLWTDPDPTVRLRAAQGLLAAGEKESIPVLIELLEGVSTDLSWQAEELLHWAAGPESPTVTIGAGSPNACRACRAAWQDWWRSHSTTVDLGKLAPARRKPGLCLVIAYQLLEQKDDAGTWSKAVSRLWLCGSDGKPRWHLDTRSWLNDAHLLSGNRVLLAQRRETLRAKQPFVQGPSIGVTERNLDGKILWQFKGDGPVHCQRLANGNTILTAGLFSGLMEVAPDGQIVFSYDGPKDFGLNGGIEPQPLRNRRFFCCLSPEKAQTLELVEFDPFKGRGRIYNRFQLPLRYITNYTLEALPNGHYLIVEQYSPVIREADRTGKVVWQYATRASHAIPLPDGNILAVAAGGIAEINRVHHTLWHLPIKEKIHRIRPCLNLLRLGFALR